MIERIIGDLDAPHAFFTRNGGVSEGSYASLNCGLGGNDEAARVTENRARAARAIGAAPADLLGLKQVHGARVVTVTAGWPAGSGGAADAMVTDRPDFALGIITADCAPVLFAEPGGRIVGAAHAGWRGALAGVLESTAAAMRALGATEIAAIIGPCIQQPSYEVGADLHAAILGAEPANARFFIATDPGHWQFDLPGYVAGRLSGCGVIVARIEQDTFADPARFFSYRRRTRLAEGPGGHQISIIKSAA